MIQKKNSRALDFPTFVQIMSEDINATSMILNIGYGRVYIEKIDPRQKRYSVIHPVKLIDIGDVPEGYDGINISAEYLKKNQEVDTVALVSEAPWVRTNAPVKYGKYWQMSILREFNAIYTYACLIARSISKDASETMVDAIALTIAPMYGDYWSRYNGVRIMEIYLHLVAEMENVGLEKIPTMIAATLEYAAKRENAAMAYIKEVIEQYPLKKQILDDTFDHLINAIKWHTKTLIL